jgi:WhiB family redox-sensing transcriptional regulator
MGRDYGVRMHPDLTWHDSAACRDSHPSIFFPADDASTRPAKLICAQCPVKSQCREYAIRTYQHHGIWGGMDERERRRYVWARQKREWMRRLAGQRAV